MKRKSDNISENDTSGAKKMKTDNYNEIMLRLSQLFQSITNSGVLMNSDELTTRSLNEIKNNIPRIVIFGNQSSGKSTLVKMLFGYENVIRAGTGTRCPIEIRIGSIYTNNTYVVNGNEKIEVKSISDAEQKLAEINKSDALIEKTIVQEIYDKEFSLIIVDLPGVKSEGYHDYFNQIKSHYLQNSETVIVHVMRGDTDPSTDNSLKYLKGINNYIVRVLTHTDIWKADPSKKAYFDIINNNYKSNNICVVNNMKNENELFAAPDMQLPDTVIKGSVLLRDHLMELMKNKRQSVIPLLRNLSLSARNVINEQLSQIGYNIPNMRDQSIHFRQYMYEHVRKEFNEDHTEFSNFVNRVKQSKSHNDLFKYFDQTVKVNLLKEEQTNGLRRKIKGSEGWSSLLTKYFKQLMDQVKTNDVPELFHNYMHVIDNITRKLFQTIYKPCTHNLQKKMIEHAIIRLQELEKESIAKLQNDLEMMAIDPNLIWDQYSTGYRIDSYTPITQSILRILSDSPNLLMQLRLNISDNSMKNLITHIVPKAIEMLNRDPYDIEAQSAHDHLKNMWIKQSEIIYGTILTHLSNMDRSYEAYLYRKIQEVDSSDLHEDDSIAVKRVSLTNFLKQIDDILSII